MVEIRRYGLWPEGAKPSSIVKLREHLGLRIRCADGTYMTAPLRGAKVEELLRARTGWFPPRTDR